MGGPSLPPLSLGNSATGPWRSWTGFGETHRAQRNPRGDEESLWSPEDLKTQAWRSWHISQRSNTYAGTCREKGNELAIFESRACDRNSTSNDRTYCRLQTHQELCIASLGPLLPSIWVSGPHGGIRPLHLRMTVNKPKYQNWAEPYEIDKIVGYCQFPMVQLYSS